MFDRLLVPLDRSRLAEQVLPTVTALATAFGSKVVLVDVCGTEDREEEQACHLYVERKAGELRASLAGSAATLTSVVIPGEAAERILSYSEAEGIDLIIMSSHGRSGLTHWSLGGTVDKVLRRAGTPLIVVRSKEPPEEGHVFKRIAVPLDGSESSAAILPVIEQLAAALPCQILLVRVIEPGKHVRTIGGLGYVPFRERDMETTMAAAREHLQKVSSGLCHTRATVCCEVRAGEAADEILGVAGERGCTLIAMSSHEHSLVKKWSMGSVTSKIVQTGVQSVWLVPSFVRE
jgi:nucleotide-binding universal stress UspA family protein